VRRRVVQGVRRALNPPPRRDPTAEEDDASAWIWTFATTTTPAPPPVGTYVQLGCAVDRAVAAAAHMCRIVQVSHTRQLSSAHTYMSSREERWGWSGKSCLSLLQVANTPQPQYSKHGLLDKQCRLSSKTSLELLS
jgi:hypothetical protein